VDALRLFPFQRVLTFVLHLFASVPLRELERSSKPGGFHAYVLMVGNERHEIDVVQQAAQ